MKHNPCHADCTHGTALCRNRRQVARSGPPITSSHGRSAYRDKGTTQYGLCAPHCVASGLMETVGANKKPCTRQKVILRHDTRRAGSVTIEREREFVDESEIRFWKPTGTGSCSLWQRLESHKQGNSICNAGRNNNEKRKQMFESVPYIISVLRWRRQHSGMLRRAAAHKTANI